MKTKFISISLLLLIGISCKTKENKTDYKNWIQIQWVDNLSGDFSFNKNWNYRDGIYRNENGELRLDSGMIPSGIEEVIKRLKDERGEIIKDSIHEYYKVIDTTHIFHSLKSEANVYESSVYNHIEFKKNKNGEVQGKTINNVSGYSHLHIKLTRCAL